MCIVSVIKNTFITHPLQICVNQVIVFSINQLLHSLNENNRIREIYALYLPNFNIGDLGSTQKGKM